MIYNKPLIDGVIKIDTREGKRKDKAFEFFGKDHCKVEQLPTGDFVYNNTVCVEFKNVKTDLFSSLSNKRLFRQVARMIQEFPIHYVMIQGNPVEHIVKMQIKKKKIPQVKWNFTVNQWDGAYSSLCQVTQVVFVNNLNHAMHMLNLLFKKSTDNKNRVYNYMEKFPSAAVTYLSCINGIGQSKSELVCEKLGLETLQDLLGLNTEQLTNVKGIGDKTADKILGAIK